VQHFAKRGAANRRCDKVIERRFLCLPGDFPAYACKRVKKKAFVKGKSVCPRGKVGIRSVVRMAELVCGGEVIVPAPCGFKVLSDALRRGIAGTRAGCGVDNKAKEEMRANISQLPFPERAEEIFFFRRLRLRRSLRDGITEPEER
jgi:hypothetical protein